MQAENAENLHGICCDRLVTGATLSDGSLHALPDACVAFRDGKLVYVGPAAEAPAFIPVGPKCPLITPGLVDAHTHACWVGSRHDEYILRMSGADYREIQRKGGGILSSHRAVAAASVDELESALVARVLRMARLGVTTVEVKSGYGLEPELELKQLEAIARVQARRGLPRIVPTFLALHAIPPEFRERRELYAARAAELVDEVASRGLARFVDAYVDANAFSVEETRPILKRARAGGLGIRLHVGQFADVGGAELAAEYGALSVDHVEHISPHAALRLAEANIAAVLLPTASLTLKQEAPPIELLRRSGVTLVVASDANPGTSPTESLPLAMALALCTYGLTQEEVLLGATVRASACLGLEPATLEPGHPADLALWDLPHESAILQPWGTARTLQVLREGVPLG